jgi:hypothetical protein
VAREVLYGDRPRRRDQVDLRCARFLHSDFHIRECGDVFWEWIAEKQFSLFDEDHCRNRGDRFAHRIDAEYCFFGHRRFRRDIQPAERTVIGDFALACDQQRPARDDPLRDLVVDSTRDTIEPLTRETDFFGRCGRKRLRL